MPTGWFIESGLTFARVFVYTFTWFVSGGLVVRAFLYSTVQIMSELTKEITENIRSGCAVAYRAYDDGDYQKALRLFYQAWLLLPKPQTRYPEAGWVLTGIGDTYFRLRQYIPGCEALRSADHCPQTRDNPFVHLRLGQCLYHMAERASARKHLHKAYRLGGPDLFAAEEPVYLNSIADLQ